MTDDDRCYIDYDDNDGDDREINWLIKTGDR